MLRSQNYLFSAPVPCLKIISALPAPALKLDFHWSIGAISISGCELAVSVTGTGTVFFKSHKKDLF